MRKYYIAPGITPDNFKIYGLLPDFKRMPDEVSKTVSQPVYEQSAYPAGGRIRFRTNSRILKAEIDIVSPNDNSNVDVLVNGRFCGDIRYTEHDGDFSGVVALEDRYVVGSKYMNDVTVDFPRTVQVKSITIYLDEDAEVEPPKPYLLDEKPVVFYGSSITMGAVSSDPSHAYTYRVAEKLGLNHINLGFGGNAKGEPEMARYIASLKMSAFVMDYEHNADSLEYLKETHEPFFKIIREAQPTLPILLISRPDTDREFLRSCMGRRTILETFHNALDNGDKYVDYVDGFYLWGNENRGECASEDGCHPSRKGFAAMAEVVAPRLKALMERNGGSLDGEHIDPTKDENGNWVL